MGSWTARVCRGCFACSTSRCPTNRSNVGRRPPFRSNRCSRSNAPFVIEQVKSLADRADVKDEKDSARRIAALYRLVLARAPEPAETAAGLRFVATRDEHSALNAWEQYVHVLLLTNELLFID